MESRFLFQPQLCLPAWLWRRPRERKSSLRSGFNPSASTVTTDMRHTSARRWGITGRAISTTAYSWAWAHGPVGVMATAGEAIASVEMAVEAITAEPGALPITDVQAASERYVGEAEPR